ncbi:MAG TPA: NHL repeat-containing protein, partial [Opitutaceae bacterium]
MTSLRPSKLAAIHLLRPGMLLAAAALLAPGAQAQSSYPNPYTISTLAGKVGFVGGTTDGTGTSALFEEPAGESIDGNGNVYIADTASDTIRMITPSGTVTTIAGTPGVVGSSDGTGAAASFSIPSSVAVDGSGNIFVADLGNNIIRKIAPGGVVTTIAGKAGVVGSADGTGPAASFASPYGIAVDGSGNIYVSDQLNNTIRKVTSAGVVTTVAGTAGVAGITDGQGTVARFRQPYGIRTDSAGNIYVADTGNSTIRKVTPSGAVTTVAGLVGKAGYLDATGTAAMFNAPVGVALDSGGDIFVADYNNNAIRKVNGSGAVTTVAGNAKFYGSVNGTGSQAEFNGPFDVVSDPSGNVYVS